MALAGNKRCNNTMRRATDPLPCQVDTQPRMAQRLSSLSLDDLGEEDSTATVYRTTYSTTNQALPMVSNPSRPPTRVSFAPLPNSPSSSSRKPSPSKIKKCKGNRRDYALGETLRHPSHMVSEYGTPEQAFQSINTLRNHDFAFVKEFDGNLIYAILACRSLEPPLDPHNSLETLEECMTFVMCNAGNTIKLRKGEWIDCVRLVSMEGMDIKSSTKTEKDGPSGGDSNGDADSDWVPPNIISFPKVGGDTFSDI